MIENMCWHETKTSHGKGQKDNILALNLKKTRITIYLNVGHKTCYLLCARNNKNLSSTITLTNNRSSHFINIAMLQTDDLSLLTRVRQ